MAKSYQEGSTWSFRLRMCGQDVYRTGFASQAEADKAQETIRVSLRQEGKASGDGPYRTTLGTAFLNYACERLPTLKGAAQDKNRINRYLRPLGLPTVELVRLESTEQMPPYWEVSLSQPAERKIPACLVAHRSQLDEVSTRSEIERAKLAGMRMADVTTYHLQALIDAMVAEGKEPATISLERAELRRLFNYARKVWRWTNPDRNPASDVRTPPVDNARDRIMTNKEWEKMSVKLAEYGNRYVVPLLALMLETAMRSCEPLTYARWGHVNWTRQLLQLPDAKTGKRDVPLNPMAITILGELAERAGNYQPDDPIFPITYEAVKKAWSVSREACGVSDIYIHDLRHTAATRYSIEYNGNLPVIKLITGHKTVEMVMRYINLKADDVVRMMHGVELAEDDAPAGYRKNPADQLPAPKPTSLPIEQLLVPSVLDEASLWEG